MVLGSCGFKRGRYAGNQERSLFLQTLVHSMLELMLDDTDEVLAQSAQI